jgi:hypothetical protein
MKPDLHLTRSFIFLAFFCAVTITSYSQVQELIPSPVDTTSEEIEVTSTETEDKASKTLTVEKDSILKINTSRTKLINEATRSEKSKEEAEEDESILSFNFIYYIIKKFKFSDIVDR